MGTIIIQIAAVFVLTVTVGIALIIALYIGTRLRIEYKAATRSEESIDDQVFEHRWRRQSLELDGNRLIWHKRSRKRPRTVINLYRVRDARVHFFAMFIRMQDGTFHQIPTGFRDQALIYAALKYYEPSPRRSTRRTTR